MHKTLHSHQSPALAATKQGYPLPPGASGTCPSPSGVHRVLPGPGPVSRLVLKFLSNQCLGPVGLQSHWAGRALPDWAGPCSRCTRIPQSKPGEGLVQCSRACGLDSIGAWPQLHQEQAGPWYPALALERQASAEPVSSGTKGTGTGTAGETLGGIKPQTPPQGHGYSMTHGGALKLGLHSKGRGPSTQQCCARGAGTNRDEPCDDTSCPGAAWEWGGKH